MDRTWLDNPAISSELLPALGETLAMTGWATAISIALGLPLGVWLFTTTPHSLAPNRGIHQVVSTIVDIGRSIPFIVLIVAIIPFTRLLVGTALGWKAAVVALTLSAIPFYARLVENALHEVSAGKVEAAQMMGATRSQIIRQVLIPEALPGLIGAATVTAVALVNYTAMAGAVGAGGLGDLAITYGYHRYQGDVMIVCIVLLVLVVGLIQLIGDRLARLVDHR
ncbi:methionine ABC transporter permease [Brevibacterium gallinarum]|uniref:ABC transporter permease n=1 Tax=Brevibacterium gallinarum TaxID=2762220 RepID=A0ABR8WXI6_9MICO|nr:methionine ABC transporter permease [Brevibacterium gallinarum]MBD8021306.1 ABC transporter permease [Brevibacterium gallinarum]